MTAILVECTDWDETYGTLTVENVDVKTVQDKIYEIKNKFYEEEFDDWCIEDVFNEFPVEWEWEYTDGVDVLEI